MPISEAAIIEALHQSHVGLLNDLRNLKAMARSESNGSSAQLRATLVETHSQIGEHFRDEEQNGYMDVVRKREPRLERAIHKLADEHQQLMQSLDDLIERAQTVEGLEAELRTGVENWASRVRWHEAQENELIQDAFNLDIGAED